MKRRQMILDPMIHYLPDPDDPALEPFGKAFVRLMFAHAALEARIRELQGVVSGEPGYGEVRRNQWRSEDRARCMTKLVTVRFGSIPEAEAIADCLTKSIPLSWERNLLAHGEWWAFDPAQQMISVRSGTERPDEDQHQQRAVADIDRTASALMDVETELYKLQSRIESRLGIGVPSETEGLLP
jgi:hypothetical protein